jgi:hypothetical protein
VQPELMVKTSVFDNPPPGAGFETCIVAVPTPVTSAARIAAVKVVALTNVVTRFDPFHCTVELDKNPEPDTVNVKLLLPAPSVEGEMPVIAGVGLLVTVKLIPPEVPPAGVGLKTVTLAAPEVPRSVLVIAAVSCVELENVVLRAELFHCTTELGVKPLPVTVSVKFDPPSGSVLGEIPVRDGTGLLMVKLKAGDESPPPGAGTNTCTDGVPPLAMSDAVICVVICVALTTVLVREAPFQ